MTGAKKLPAGRRIALAPRNARWRGAKGGLPAERLRLQPRIMCNQQRAECDVAGFAQF